MTITIENLPDTAVANIMVYLDSKSFWSRVNLVCKKWYIIWKTDMIIKNRKKNETRICQKKFDLPHIEMTYDICKVIAICGDKIGRLMRNGNENHVLEINNLKTNDKMRFINIVPHNGYNLSLELYEKYIIVSYSGRRVVYEYKKNYIKYISELTTSSWSESHILINNKNQLIQSKYNEISVFEDCNITSKITDPKLDELNKTIKDPYIKYDRYRNLYYMGGPIGKTNFYVVDDLFNIIHSECFDTKLYAREVKKIIINNDKLYLVCKNWVKKNEDNTDEIRYVAEQDRHDDFTSYKIIILDRNTYKTLSNHDFDHIDLKFLCVAKNLIICKLDDQMNNKLKMMVYDTIEKKIVKKIKLDVLWYWAPYRGEWENDFRDVPEYGNIVNYNDEKLIMIGKKGLIYYKLR